MSSDYNITSPRHYSYNLTSPADLIWNIFITITMYREKLTYQKNLTPLGNKLVIAGALVQHAIYAGQ